MKPSYLALIATLLLSASSASFAIGDNKLAERIAEEVGVSQEVARKMVDAFKEEVILQLRDGNVVRLHKFGRFYVEERPARAGNPGTGEMRPIPAKNLLRFQPSRQGNDSLN